MAWDLRKKDVIDGENAFEFYVGKPYLETCIGILISLVALGEGICFVIGAVDVGSTFASIGHYNPFHKHLWYTLAVAGIGSIVAGVVGLFGMYSCHYTLPDVILSIFALDKSHVDRCLHCVSYHFAWSAFVLVGAVPWCGIALAFAPPAYDKSTIILVLALYFSIKVFLLCLMGRVYRFAAIASRIAQENDAEMRARERQHLLDYARSRVDRPIQLDEPPLLEFLPLELTTFVYLFLSCILSLMALCSPRSLNMTSGWAFPLQLSAVRITRSLGVSVSIFAAVVTLCGALAMIVYHFYKKARDSAGTFSNSEEARRAEKLMKRATAVMLATFLLTLLRVSLFIPLTSMALASTNVCGLYVRALWSIAPKRSYSNLHSGPLHCSGDDAFYSLVILCLAALDMYLCWGIFRLWRKYRGTLRVEHGSTKTNNFKSGCGYGVLMPGGALVSRNSIVKDVLL